MARLSWPGWLITYRGSMPAWRRSLIRVLSGLNVDNFVDTPNTVTAMPNHHRQLSVLRTKSYCAVAKDLRTHKAKEADHQATGGQSSCKKIKLIVSHFVTIQTWTYWCLLASIYLHGCHKMADHFHADTPLVLWANCRSVLKRTATVSGKLTGWFWTLLYDELRVRCTVLLLH